MIWISFSKKGFALTFNTPKGDLVIEGTITVWYHLFKYVSIMSMVLYDDSGYTRQIDFNEAYDLLNVRTKLGLKNLICEHYDYTMNGGETSTASQIGKAIIKGIVMFILLYFALDFLGIFRR